MSAKDPNHVKLKNVMSKPGKDCTAVSKKYWDTIWDGVLDYLEDLGLIQKSDRDDVRIAISDYIRHQSPKGPQPQWGNP
ncbi:MAG: hypothetical protein ACE5I5_06700 [Candidatus Heimdallarchaeota archaeon]